jgi:hypothetical protein
LEEHSSSFPAPNPGSDISHHFSSSLTSFPRTGTAIPLVSGSVSPIETSLVIEPPAASPAPNSGGERSNDSKSGYVIAGSILGAIVIIVAVLLLLLFVHKQEHDSEEVDGFDMGTDTIPSFGSDSFSAFTDVSHDYDNILYEATLVTHDIFNICDVDPDEAFSRTCNPLGDFPV